MARYRNDPYKTTAKFSSTCPDCTQRIKRGDSITVWPSAKKGRKARHWTCSEADYRQFEGAAMDEEIFYGGSNYRPGI